MQTNTNDKLTLANLNDHQKSLLTRLSYLGIDMDKFEELKQDGKEITISDLASVLSDPDTPYLGDIIHGSTKYITGVGTSNKELLDQLVDSGLGDLTVVDIVDSSKSGFYSICFSDSSNNKGFSFRGTDVKSFSSLAKDSITDFEGFLTNDTEQISQANELFEQLSNNDGKNYLYGHSLGGFLAENLYANNYENIANAYVINPLHINQEQLNTQDKINAFNNPEKFNCYVTGGDYVSPINSDALFEDNVKYIQNNHNNKNNIIGNHLIEAASFDENGNFITQSKEEAYKDFESPIASKAISILNNNKFKSFLSNGFNIMKKFISFTTKGFNSAKDFVGSKVTNIKDGITNLFDKNSSNVLQSTNTSNYRDSLKLENFINNSTYTRADYERAKAVLQNPMHYLSDNSNYRNSLEIESDDKVPWPQR